MTDDGRSASQQELDRAIADGGDEAWQRLHAHLGGTVAGPTEAEEINPSTWSTVATLTGHTDAVLSVAWSPDGTKLATGSWDATVRIWSVSGANPSTPTGLALFISLPTFWLPFSRLGTTPLSERGRQAERRV